MYFHLLLLKITLLASVNEVRSEGPIVVTPQGAIQGSRLSASYFTVERFLGIRYGLVPRRFAYSQVNNNSWTGVLDATEFGPICPQNPSSFPIDDDCLFINIWRPAMSTADSTLLPVLLWVHGSGFQEGSGAQISGDLLAPYGNMIVATINYRLRSFGWAFGDENEMPGNQAVSDVINALNWVHQNIAFFGGDPSQVTVAGNSAGSMISSILPVLTSLDDSLYSRLWLMSGVSVTPMFIEDTSVGLAKTKLLASKVGCGSDTPGPLTNETISCLQTLDVSAILEHDLDFEIKELGGNDFPSFLTVYGTPLITKPLVQLFKSNPKTRRTNIFIGISQDEAGNTYGDYKPTNKSEAYTMAFERLTFIKKDATEAQMQSFFEYYFNGVNEDDPKALRTALTNFITDLTWGCGALMLSELYSTYHSVRFAVFKYVLDVYSNQERPDGPQHSDSIPLYFGEPFMSDPPNQHSNAGTYSNQDKIQSLRLMKSLAEFAWGIEPNDWPELHFNSSNPEKEPTVREINVQNRNVEYSKQHICREWSKLLDFEITKD